MKWDRVCLALEKGGIGCKYILAMNVALKGKWLWREGEEEGELWRVIGDEYGESVSKWVPNSTRRPYGGLFGGRSWMVGGF